MASSSKSVKEKFFFEVELVSNVVKQPNLKVILDISYKQDLSCTLSMISPKVIMFQDVRKCYKCKVGGIGDMEIRKA